MVAIAQKRTPPESFARLKTHTPLRHMQVSGLRYYSPELGRWILRRPIQVTLRPGEYLFTSGGDNLLQLLSPKFHHLPVVIAPVTGSDVDHFNCKGRWGARCYMNPGGPESDWGMRVTIPPAHMTCDAVRGCYNAHEQEHVRQRQGCCNNLVAFCRQASEEDCEAMWGIYQAWRDTTSDRAECSAADIGKTCLETVLDHLQTSNDECCEGDDCCEDAEDCLETQEETLASKCAGGGWGADITCPISPVL